jgi:threonine dehydrogenase-like Zn-dependent dehydrogenase
VGTVGILAAHCAFARGANRVVLIDQVDFRLNFAKKKLPKVRKCAYSSMLSVQLGNNLVGKCVRRCGWGPTSFAL